MAPNMEWVVRRVGRQPAVFLCSSTVYILVSLLLHWAYGQVVLPERCLHQPGQTVGTCWSQAGNWGEGSNRLPFDSAPLDMLGTGRAGK